MGGDASKLRRNNADNEVWQQATSDSTVAAKARLEAMALVAKKPDVSAAPAMEDDGAVALRPRLRRLAYSSVLAVKSKEEARKLLTTIFCQALINNPALLIGGILYYDEETSSLVQVLEGPRFAVRSLFYHRIMCDSRHTAVRRLWDIEVAERRYEGFGMQVGRERPDDLDDPASSEEVDPSLVVPQPGTYLEGGGEAGLVRLTYTSTITATYRSTAYRLVMDILRVAVVKNTRLSIGGCLFLNPWTFRVMQVLEGDEQAVHALYKTISNDLRHEDCVVLSAVRVEERIYKEWGMLQGELDDWSELATGDWTGPASVEAPSSVHDSADEKAAPGLAPAVADGIGGRPAELGVAGSSSFIESLLGCLPASASGGAPAAATAAPAEAAAAAPAPQSIEPLLPRAKLVVGPSGPVVRWSSSVEAFPERAAGPDHLRVPRIRKDDGFCSVS